VARSDRESGDQTGLNRKVLLGVEDFWYECEIPTRHLQTTTSEGDDGPIAPRWEQDDDGSPKPAG
jgi:hypothetical protein